MSQDLVKQTKNAFDFIQKLYFEVSYLIKEVEGLLGQEPEEFIIGRPSGYAVTNKTSSGLEPISVDNWMPKTFTVSFIASESTEIKKGQTITPVNEGLKVLLLDIELVSKKNGNPRVAAGCIYDIVNKRPKDYTKFEHLLWKFSYDREKVFATLPKIDSEDSYVAIKGDFVTAPLFSINDSEKVVKKLVEPMLNIYRNI